MNATEITGLILAAAGAAGAAAAASVRLLDKLVELVGSRRAAAGDYSPQQEATRTELLAEVRELRGQVYQVRIEVREIAHKVLLALGVPRGIHGLPDDVKTQEAAGGAGEGDEP